MINEDRELVRRVLVDDDREAFGRLVKKYNRMAGAISYGICGDFHAAEDVVQDAFLKAYDSLSMLRDSTRFKYWLAGIVRSKTIDYIRQRKNFWSLPSNTSASSAGVSGGYADRDREAFASESVDELFIREEFRGKILEAIRGLPEKYRLVITLKHMEGLSYKEISEITDSTVSALESRLFRAREALRKKLDHILKS
jgi:RNA polymerase sigma-70 factor (ECF subfamily)